CRQKFFADLEDIADWKHRGSGKRAFARRELLPGHNVLAGETLVARANRVDADEYFASPLAASGHDVRLISGRVVLPSQCGGFFHGIIASGSFGRRWIQSQRIDPRPWVVACVCEAIPQVPRIAPDADGVASGEAASDGVEVTRAEVVPAGF